MTFRTIRLEAQGPVAFLTLDRATEGNLIDQAFLRELDEACASINADAGVRAVVLASDGDPFSRGWADSVAPPVDRSSEPAFTCLESMGQPVICAIQGEASSAGLELALACDVRIASKEASFALPETALGGLPRAGGTQRLARVVGHGHALRMILLGEPLDADEALRVGLVSAVHPSGRLRTEAEKLAARMASRGPIALRYAKEAVRRGLEMPLDEALRMETDLTVILQTTEDRTEGVRAFIEKREPHFKGR